MCVHVPRVHTEVIKNNLKCQSSPSSIFFKTGVILLFTMKYTRPAAPWASLGSASHLDVGALE